MGYKKSFLLLAAACMVLCSGCGSKEDSAVEGQVSDVPDGTENEGKEYEDVQEAIAYVEGYSFGPGVSKIILRIGQETDSVEAGDVKIKTARISREVSDVYLCDAEGNPVEDSSDYVAFALTEEHMAECSPFSQGQTYGTWAGNYPVRISADAFRIGGETYSLNIQKDCGGSRVCPDAALFSYRTSFAGEYENPLTGAREELKLQMAAYEPEELAGNEKKPLIIWLHGAGEGGTDLDAAVLGNRVSALAKEEVQAAFTSGDEKGAYVLVPQCSTYWMDEGDGTNGAGSGESRYTEILMDAILDYLGHNQNIDRERIYLAGCSNGGYMTMNMLVHYPDFFAAAVPVCEAYSFHMLERNEAGQYVFTHGSTRQREDGVWMIDYDAPEGRKVGAMGSLVTDEVWMTDEKVQAVKDTPVWFVASVDDTIVPVEQYALPTYRALRQAGAENCWISLFESYGHSAWIPFLDNQVTGVQDGEQVAAGSEEYQILPDNRNGGSFKADEYNSVFEWLNGQRKGGE